MDFTQTLQSLEPIFVQAGELACKMQRGVERHNKYNTGNPAADIVTAADLAVQELLLEAMSKTDLINCRLLAEENTPLTDKFNEQGQYYLAIDPIDDTAIYAKDGQYFSQIISLHDGKKFLYMFVQFPALNWTHRIIHNNYFVSGQTPNFPLPPEAEKIIVYWSGSPEKNLPEKLYTELKNKGLSFAPVAALSKDVGSIAMFASNRVAGVYQENMNVYDALTEYNIALAKGLSVYAAGSSGTLDLSNIQKRQNGLYYPGYCLELNNLA
jgi:fructose-1,6-bisphosphatase/inositol monophosphatase family enzyme